MSVNGNDALDWLATQYLLGELSDAERDAFEARLVDDIAACEAVARASELTSALQVVLTEMPNPTVGRFAQPTVLSNNRRSISARGSRWTIAVAFATVASLVAIVSNWTLTPERPSEQIVAEGSAYEAAEQVAPWSDDLRVVEADEAEDTELQEPPGEVSVPDWLVAGVMLQQQISPDSTEHPVQEN